MTFEELFHESQIKHTELAFLASVHADVSVLLEYPQMGQADFFDISARGLFDFYRYCSDRGSKPTDSEYGMYLTSSSERKLFHQQYDVISYLASVKDFAYEENFGATWLDWTRLRVLKQLSEKGYVLKPEYKKMGIDEIYSKIESGVQEIFLNLSSELKVDTMHISDDFVAELDEGIAQGYKYRSVFPYMSHLTNGLNAGGVMLVGGAVNSGKSTLAFNNIIMSALEDNPGESALIIANEMEDKDYKILAISRIIAVRLEEYKFNRRRLKEGKFSKIEKAILQKAVDIWNKEYQHRIYFVKMYSYDMAVIGRLMKQYNKLHNVNIALLDTLKADNAGEWAELVESSKKFYQVCSQTGIAGLATVQLKLADLRDRILDLSSTAGAKGISEVASEVVFIRHLHREELDEENRYYCKPFRMEKDSTGKYVKEEMNLNPDNRYLVAFHTKTRNSEVGTQLVLKFLGNVGVFQEVGQCQVVEKSYR